ncbi:hypothetical protein ATERTT37_007364 [Aspergillus terreus]
MEPITSALRTITPWSAQGGPIVTEILDGFLPSELWTFKEVASVTGSQTDFDDAKHLSCILRDDLEERARANNEVLVLAAALTQSPPGTSQPYAEILFNLRTISEKQEWFREYVGCLLNLLLPPLVHHGIGLEAHGQNILARVCHDTGEIKGFAVRDFGGIRLHTPTLRDQGVSFDGMFPGWAVMTENMNDVWGKVHHSLLQNHVGFLLNALDLQRHHGWSIVRDVLEGGLRGLPDNGLYEFCLKDTMPLKCFLRMSMEGKYRDSREPMADVVARASKLKPEIRLSQAVSEFQASIPQEEKTKFQKWTLSLSTEPPESWDVAKLTSEIDRRVSGQTRRCYGPRFMNVLQAVQQYASLGDIVIGGSQNLAACGVWAVVRLTLTHAVKFLNKNTISRISSAVFDSTLHQFQTDMHKWATMIREEVTWLNSQLNVDESKQNSAFRKMVAKFKDSSGRHYQLEAKLRLLDACSTRDYQTPWKQARKRGVATWFTTAPEYQQWKQQSVSGTLLCTGKLGSGKTTLMASMVDDLVSTCGKGNLVYFFCRYDITESLTARAMFGSLTRQLLCQQTVELARLQQDYASQVTLDCDKMLEILQTLLSHNEKYYILVDGLDECPQSEIETIIELLQNLQRVLSTLICISYREEARSPVEELSKEFAQIQTLKAPEINPDIEAYIDAELQGRLQSDELTIGDPTVVLSIQEALLKGAQGMLVNLYRTNWT